jgi:hypothetical protein
LETGVEILLEIKFARKLLDLEKNDEMKRLLEICFKAITPDCNPSCD